MKTLRWAALTLLMALAYISVHAQSKVIITDPNQGQYSSTIFTPRGAIWVQTPPSQLFLEAFDAANGYDTSKWKTPTAAGGAVAALAEQADTKLGTGTTANGFSYFESTAAFAPVTPAWLEIMYGNNIPNPYVANTYFFWGLGTSPTTPTAAAPLTEAVGFEVFTDGNMYAIMYQGGARQIVANLSLTNGACSPNACQPADSAVHYYFIEFRGDHCYWYIMTDNTRGTLTQVAQTSTGGPGPNINVLPLKVTAIASTGAPLSNAQVTVNVVSIGDTSRSGGWLVDAKYPNQRANITTAGALTTQTAQPTIVQKISSSSTGSVASLVKALNANTTAGNSLIVVAGVGNVTAPTVTDTCGGTYKQATTIANGAFNSTILYATNIGACTDTVTVTNGGANASIAMEVYEVSGLVALSPQVLDATSTGSATGTALSAGGATPAQSNELAFAGFAVGTAAQTITVTSPYTNDSGQLNPTTPAGLFSFASASSYLMNLAATTPAATITSEPWAAAVATFRTVSLPIVAGTSINTEGVKQTYHCAGFVTPAAAPTDVVLITGSATKTVRITSVAITVESTTAGIADVLLLRRSTAASGGSSTTPTIGKMDTNNAAATAVCTVYTANPTVGNTVANVGAQKQAGTQGVPARFDFSTRNGQAMVLRGVTDFLAVNGNGDTLLTGELWAYDIEFTEE